MQKEWTAILAAGEIGEFSSNAYGPIHNLFAFVFDIHHKLPRVIFGVLPLLASGFLIYLLNERGKLNSLSKWLPYLLLYNPIVWIMFVINGCNDGLVGFLFFFGIYFYDRENYGLSAFSLTIAILVKFIPIFVIPILCIGKGKINWRFTFFFLLFFVIGIGLSYSVWGENLLKPFLKNANRESKILSIFRYLRGEFSFLRLFSVENVDFLSSPVVVLGTFGIFIAHVFRKWNWLVSLILTLLFIHVFFAVGHFQFQISVYLILSYFIITRYSEEQKNELTKLTYCLWWIAGSTFLYGITEGFYGSFRVIREVISVPQFLILAATAVTLIQGELENKYTHSQFLHNGVKSIEKKQFTN